MQQRERLLGRSQKPTTESVAAFVGAADAARWSALLDFIESSYPGVFHGEWLYGGANHGWSLRFRKSKSFCTLVPERGRMRVLVVFGAAEREKMRNVLPGITSHVRDDYLAATTYRDGRWVLMDVDSDEVLRDVERLLTVKRRPKSRRDARQAPSDKESGQEVLLNRPRVIVHTAASVDGRVSLGPGRTGFDDVGDARWQAMWVSDTALEKSVTDLVSFYRPQVLLEGSGSFVSEAEVLPELPPSEFDEAELQRDYLPHDVVDRPGHVGWFAVVDGRGRVRAGMKEFPGWEGWRTLHLVARSTPVEYLAFLRRREIPYLVSGQEQVDLEAAMDKMVSLLRVSCLVCTAGSRLNGALLRADLIDEVSLVILPALVGGSETPVLFRCKDLGPADWPARLELLSMDSEPTGRIHLRYRVVVPEGA